MIRIQAPAKVNLNLRVLAREASGYHSIETLFCAISLADEVGAARAGSGVDLRVEGASPTARPGENIVYRAARRFAAGTGVPDGFAIRLVKRVPAAAGLGGGSADAAATLLALNALCGEPADPDALLDWGAELGSDVPFFLCGSPLALGWGRGQRLLALPPLPSRPLLIANPGVPMPTAQAFERLAELRGPDHRVGAGAVPHRDLESWEGIARHAINDFERVALERLPVVGDMLSTMREAGALIAMLAGSGASVYGVFDDLAARDAADGRLAELGLTTWRAETLETVPIPRPVRD